MNYDNNNENKLETFDSSTQTLEHIQIVRNGLGIVIKELIDRAENHDVSKLSKEEKPIFDKYTQRLKNTTYGSDEYNGFLKSMKPALKHHYANNRHHPEYHKNGINGMNLVDLIELVIDWNAACKRHDNGNIFRSIEINQKRFGYNDSIKRLLTNTAQWLLTIQK